MFSVFFLIYCSLIDGTFFEGSSQFAAITTVRYLYKSNILVSLEHETKDQARAKTLKLVCCLVITRLWTVRLLLLGSHSAAFSALG